MPPRRSQAAPPVASTSTSSSFSFSRPTRSSPAISHIIPPLPPADTSSNLSTDQLDSLRRQSNFSTLSLSPRRPASSASTATAHPGTAKRRTSSWAVSARGNNTTQFEESFMGNAGGESGFEEREEGGFDEDDEGVEWSMVDRMRNWRNDAMTQHLYATADFWGSKVFGITGNPNDAFWLSQIHFYTHKFSQAELLLTSLRGSPPTRLTDSSLACRYLAAQCQVRLGKWEEALEMVGRGGFSWDGAEVEGDGDGGIKLTASTAHLRGLIHLHLGATDLAKEAFVEALSRDVKCFESFEMLVGSEMMSAEEEWEFIQGLQYAAQTGEDADFVKMMYTTKLREEMTVARERLTNDFGLGDDPDVMFGLADELYSGLRFAECYRITSRILAKHSSHRPTLPVHLACMQHLPNLRSRLYLLAQDLVESEPDDAISWYAVGMWYFSGRRWEESRRFFGKSVLIDARFGPAWIAFAHSYAYEGEHDQAITAYSTALRHFQGSHLPLLFIGMQYLGLSNIKLAQEYLEAAKEGCRDDPVVLNELGVVAHHEGKYDDAIAHFKQSLLLAKEVQGSKASTATTHLNLGHAYRKLGRLQDAHASFRKVLDLDPRSAAAYSALGLVEHQLGNHQESISRYHEALSLVPGDPVTCDLLKLVLEETALSVSSGIFPFPGLPPTTIINIDEQVAKLDAEITGLLPGEEQSIVSELGEDIAVDQDEVSVSYGGDEEGEQTMDETMDMSG